MIRPWVRTVKLKQFLDGDDGDESAQQAGKKIADALSTDVDLSSFATNFRRVKTCGQFNMIMSTLYDHCDLVRIWVD